MSLLLDNAISSIRVGAQDFEANTGDRDLSALRNIYAGILLLFKEKLRQQSPVDSLELFVKARTGLKVIEDGRVVPVGKGKKTVNVYQILDHFETLSIEIDKIRFEHLTKLRNEIEHYYTEKTRAVIQNALNDAFVIIRDFITVQLENEPVNVLGQEAWRVLLLNSEIFELENRECKEQWEKSSVLNHETIRVLLNGSCPSCHSTLTVPNDIDNRDIYTLSLIHI